MSHTEGKLRVLAAECREHTLPSEFAFDLRANIELVAVVKLSHRHPAGAVAEANARRLVACWNACEDMSNPDLVIADLREDRDALPRIREALSACLENMKIRRGSGTESGPTIERLIEQAEDALLTRHKPKVPA